MNDFLRIFRYRSIWLAVVLLCFTASFSLAQTTKLKSIGNDTLEEYGAGFIRFHPDSLIWCSSLSDLQNNNPFGFELYISDLNLNMNLIKRYTSPTIFSNNLISIDSNSFIVCGGRDDSVNITPGWVAIVEGIVVVKMNYQGDTLWARSYVTTDTIKGINLTYTGKTGDTLIFHGSIRYDNNYYDTCGLLLHINSTDGAILNTYTYCDSLYSCGFQRAIFDSSERKIYLAGTRLSKNGLSLDQVFYTELNMEGEPLIGYFVSDTSDIGYIGFMAKSQQNNTVMLGYRTDKYQTWPGGTDFEMLLLDSSGQLISCKYLPNFGSGALTITSAELFEPSNTYRLWTEYYFIDIDNSMNYLNGQWVNFALPYAAYPMYKKRTFNDFIWGMGLMKPSTIDDADIMLVKALTDGTSCYSSPLNLQWNLLPGNTVLTPFLYTKAVYSNIQSKPLILNISAPAIQDTTLCITSGHMESQISNTAISLFPNPAGSELFIKGLLNGETIISIYDLTGREVLNKIIYNYNNKVHLHLDIRDLAGRSYYMVKVIQHRNFIYSSKLFKS